MSESAIKRRDPISRYTWLQFDGRPDPATIQRLKANGWRWSGYRQQWYSNARFPTVPAGVTVEEGGEADYASERAERLQQSADRHARLSTDAYERSNAAVAHIPLGQPILVGHHSERGHRADLARSHRAMDQSVAEQRASESLAERAKSSARHQARQQTPAAMARRADRLEAEHRAMTRNIERRAEQLQRDGQQPTEADELYQQRAASVKAEAEALRAAVAEAGGLVADREEVKPGDIIKIHGFIGRVERVNPKTYSVDVGGSGPRWILKLDRSYLQGIIKRADEARAELTAPTERPTQPA